MPLVFSPLSEAVLDLPPTNLRPKCAFVMRQLGDPPEIDRKMNDVVKATFKKSGVDVVDASDTTGSKDYLERILSLIRGTGFTVAIFSHDTRVGSLANICLELGFAAMCGKPIIIVKSKEASAPSDLKRTDWVEFEDGKLTLFRKKLRQGISQIKLLSEYEETLLGVALEARIPDCGVALERANKGFLLSGQEHFIESAEKILEILDGLESQNTVDDLERLKAETKTFIKQARASLAAIRTPDTRVAEAAGAELAIDRDPHATGQEAAAAPLG